MRPARRVTRSLFPHAEFTDLTGSVLSAVKFSARDLLNVQQTVEERAVALQSYAEIFCGDVIATAPLPFQFFPLFGETVGESLDHFRDERVCLFDGAAWLVHKPGLNLRPSCPEIVCLVVREQRCRRIFPCCSIASLGLLQVFR